jgi:hypothetical protein
MTFKLSGMVLGVNGAAQTKLDKVPGSTSLLVDLSARIVPSIEQAILDPMKHQVCCSSVFWNQFVLPFPNCDVLILWRST